MRCDQITHVIYRDMNIFNGIIVCMNNHHCYVIIKMLLQQSCNETMLKRDVEFDLSINMNRNRDQ